MRALNSLGIWLAAAVVVVSVAGCKGDPGAQGPQGPEGTQGPAGPAGPAYGGITSILAFADPGTITADDASVTLKIQLVSASGDAVTGREMTAAIAKAAARPVVAKQLGWWTVHTFGRLIAMGRELSEMAYLWNVPHRISGDRLERVIGTIPHTPFDIAVATAVRELGVASALKS